MTPGGYNNNVQLFQTSEYVALLNEMNHNVRMIPLDGRAHSCALGFSWTLDCERVLAGGVSR